MFKILIIFLCFQSISLFACDIEGYFFPKNNLRIPVSQKSAGLTESQFSSIIDEFQAIYGPMFKERGSNLKINKNWKSPMVNARAHRRGFTRYVTMYGGMARHMEMNELGFALVICHEIGHHIGGAPKADPIMSGEGQSDYFAATKCMRRYFRSKNIQKTKNELFARKKCSSVYANEAEVDNCVLTAQGGISLSRIFATLLDEQMPRLDTPDTSVARRTNSRHAVSQCRLDTYFAGALCDNDINTRFGQTDENIGGCSTANGDTIGLRPACWYKARN